MYCTSAHFPVYILHTVDECIMKSKHIMAGAGRYRSAALMSAALS